MEKNSVDLYLKFDRAALRCLSVADPTLENSKYQIGILGRVGRAVKRVRIFWNWVLYRLRTGQSMSDLKARKIVKEFYRNRKDPTQGTIAKIERLREALLYRRRDRGRSWGAAKTVMRAASIADAKWDPEVVKCAIEEEFLNNRPLLITTGWEGKKI